MQHPQADRQSRMANSRMHAPPKKDGSGGKYTWGNEVDDPTDYAPVGVQGEQKVVTAKIEEPSAAKGPAPPTSDVKPESTEQFPPLSSVRMRSTAKATVKQGADLVTSLKGRTGVVVDQLQKVASERVASPLARRAAHARSRASQARALVREYVLFMTGLGSGIIAWNYEEIRSKGIRSWALESGRTARVKAIAAAGGAKVKATKLASQARDVAKEKSFQATAASAAGGAVTLGTTGGVTGLATGTAVGAAVGLVPALFTFGLSIPVFAAIGGTCGMVTGAAAGGTVGAVAGGAAGYGAYAKRDKIAGAVSYSRDQIATAASKTLTSVNDSAGYAKSKAVASAGYARDQAAVVRAKLSGGGTGSTA